MTINLNDNSILENQGSSIFNGGNAGRVENVIVTVEPKPADDESRSPDAKIFFEDGNGKMNLGFYHFTPNDTFDEKVNARMANDSIIRLLSIAKCLVPSDYQFPDVAGKSQKEIEKLLLGTIKKYEGGRVNVFAAYGTKNKPKRFMEPRRYGFVEKAGTSKEDSKLIATNTDLLVRPEADNNIATNLNGGSQPSSNKGSETTDSFWN